MQRTLASAYPGPRVQKLLWLAAAISAPLLVCEPAHAHPQTRSYCTVATVPSGFDVEIESAAHDVARAIGLASAAPEEVLAALPRLEQQLLDTVRARTPEAECRARPGAARVSEREGQVTVAVPLAFECPEGPVTLRITWLADVAPLSDVLCAVDGTPYTFTAIRRELSLGTPPRLADVLRAFLWSGAKHVWLGADHVLFLVLLAVAALGDRVATGRLLLWRLLRVITGFTLGHTATLLLAGFGYVVVPERLTETIIALSIVVVGVENVRTKEPRFRSLNALLFGLVHGFGFASALGGAGLPERGAAAALLLFNLGVEFGQAALVLGLAPVLMLTRRARWYRTHLLVPVSVVVAALALIWAVKRATDLRFLSWLGQ